MSSMCQRLCSRCVKDLWYNVEAVSSILEEYLHLELFAWPQSNSALLFY